MKRSAPDIQEQARAIHGAMLHLRRHVFVASTPADLWASFSRQPTFAQMKALLALQHLSPTTLKGLAVALQVSGATASELLDRLVEMEMVTRSPDAHDRRRIVVELAPEARRCLQSMEESIVLRIQDLLGRMDADRVREWVRISEYLSTFFSQESEDANDGHGIDRT